MSAAFQRALRSGRFATRRDEERARMLASRRLLSANAVLQWPAKEPVESALLVDGSTMTHTAASAARLAAWSAKRLMIHRRHDESTGWCLLAGGWRFTYRIQSAEDQDEEVRRASEPLVALAARIVDDPVALKGLGVVGGILCDLIPGLRGIVEGTP